MRSCSGLWFPKLSNQTKSISKFSNIVKNIVDVTWCPYYNIWIYCLSWRFRSSCSKSFYEKDVLKNLVKFTAKHLCLGLFFNNVAGLKPASLSNRDSGTEVFLRVLRKDLFYKNLKAASEEQLFMLKSLLVMFQVWSFRNASGHYCREQTRTFFVQRDRSETSNVTYCTDRYL